MILSGGLGLGAYQAGALEVILASDRFALEAIAGSSIGAINGALIASAPADDRLGPLRAFWEAVAMDGPTTLDPFGLATSERIRHAMNLASAALARIGGVPNLFRPRWPGEQEPARPCASLYAIAPLRRLLSSLIDFDRLNASGVRLCVGTCDVVAGEPVPFDTGRGDRITLDHLMASGALLPAFSPVEVEGRLLADGGLAFNAPLQTFLASDRTAADWPLAILIDLFSPDDAPPTSLEASIARSTDLQFAMQTATTLSALARERALEARLEPERPGCDLFHIRYRPLGHEAGPEKAYDFSRATLRDRMEAGADDALRMLERIDAARIEGAAGLRVHSGSHGDEGSEAASG